MEDNYEALKEAHTTLLDAAIASGAFGYYIHRGVNEAGQVSSVVFATTSPEVIGLIYPALWEVEKLGRPSD